MNEIEAAQTEVRHAVAAPGDWLTGSERVAVWREVRLARNHPLDEARRAAVSPYAVEGEHGAASGLTASAVEVVHRTASDPGRLTRTWAKQHISTVGEEIYTELVGVTAIVTVLDRFDRAMGRSERPLPEPVDGEPTRVRPDGVGDVGAWVDQTTGATRANVTRSLSLVPVTDRSWRQLVETHYSHGAAFTNLRWDRPLSRPQTELVAARTTALSECFY